MINAIDTKRNTRTKTRIPFFGWSVLMIQDCFGYGFIAQPTAHNNEAMRDGWVLITDGLNRYEAANQRDNLKTDATCLDLSVY